MVPIWEFLSWNDAVAFCKSGVSLGIDPQDLVPFQIFRDENDQIGRACVGWLSPNDAQAIALSALATASIADLTGNQLAQIRLGERIARNKSSIPSLTDIEAALREMAEKDPGTFKRLRGQLGN